MKGYTGNIEKITEDNANYREVIYTGPNMQLVVMALQPGEEIGLEAHDTHDQFFRIEEGECKIIMDGEETVLKDGDAAIVPAGTEHNVINTGSEALKLYTIYAPPEHAPGTIHATKADDTH
ncbi:MAG: cupin [Candidatus Moranbacteria bacterium RIFCSPHIGHO2_01_FULL_55_24]|nr:MAG: cupin [Candidatus Moranbacteria bacterium RIFCSPHIGHO2_01_FULL_55_24]